MNEDLSSLSVGGPLVREGDELIAANGRRYPIVKGIPRFVSADNYASDFGWQWTHFPKTQLDSNTGKPISLERLSRCLRGNLPDVRGKRVLEAGSGAGRFTEILLAHGALLDTFDYSIAVEANAENNGSKRFTLVQADIRAMPFEPASYDYVICLGVLQHTPNTEESIGKLWEMVKPGGALVIDHYRRTRAQLPPPIGNALWLWRKLFLALPRRKRWGAVKRLVDTFFPLYWRFRDGYVIRRLLDRVAGINFYYPALPLGSREAFYEWALLDTHDASTDYYRRFRTPRSIASTLNALGAEDIDVRIGGNGVEAFCRKPTRPFSRR